MLKMLVREGLPTPEPHLGVERHVDTMHAARHTMMPMSTLPGQSEEEWDMEEAEAHDGSYIVKPRIFCSVGAEEGVFLNELHVPPEQDEVGITLTVKLILTLTLALTLTLNLFI